MSDLLHCPICGRKYKKWSGLKHHFLTHHLYPMCPICGKRFNKGARHVISKHARIKGNNCDDHKILYALTISKNHKSDFYQVCVKIATEKLSTGEVKWRLV